MADHNIKDTLENVSEYIGGKVKDGLGTKEDVFRYTTMPEASEDYLGKCIQYIGHTNSNYTKNCFYECISTTETVNEEDITIYSWQATKVQDSKYSGRDLLLRIDDGLRPYLKYDIHEALKSFSETDPYEMLIVSQAYYDGDLTLEDIQEVWKIGDEVNIPLEAIPANIVPESHAAQTVKMKIIDFDHDILTTPKGGKENALMTFGFLLAENGEMSNDNAHGYSTSLRRQWCNEVCINALPRDLKDSIVSVEKTNGIGAEGNGSGTRTTSDLLFIPNLTEFYTGGFGPGKIYRTYHIDQDGGSRYEWWKSDSHLLAVGKAFWTATSAQYYNSDAGRTIFNQWMYIPMSPTGNGQGYKNDTGCTAELGLYVHGCI